MHPLLHPKDNPTCPFHVLYYISSPSRCISSPFPLPRPFSSWMDTFFPDQIQGSHQIWCHHGWMTTLDGAPIDEVDATKMVGFLELSTRFLWDRDLFSFIGDTFHSRWNFGNGIILGRRELFHAILSVESWKDVLTDSPYTCEMVCQPSMQHCITLEIRKFCVFVSSDTFLSFASSIYLLLSSSSNFETRNYPGVIVENRLPLSVRKFVSVRSDRARCYEEIWILISHRSKGFHDYNILCAFRIKASFEYGSKFEQRYKMRLGCFPFEERN